MSQTHAGPFNGINLLNSNNINSIVKNQEIIEKHQTNSLSKSSIDNSAGIQHGGLTIENRIKNINQIYN